MKIAMFNFNREKFAETMIDEQINEWFEGNPEIEIKHILQSESHGPDGEYSFSVSIFYEEKGKEV
ncbi:MAG: hypothetical protein ABH950_09930 [Candidatus Altiarchaeota archaeon]